MAREKRRESVLSGEGDNGIKEESIDPARQNDETSENANSKNADATCGANVVDKDADDTVEEKNNKITTVEISEKDIEEMGTKIIGSALEEQRVAQKLAFHKLIDDNVELGREKQQVGNGLKEMKARYEVKVIELDDERTKTEMLNKTVKDMERDIKRLKLAAKQTKNKKPSFRRTQSQTAEDNVTDSDCTEQVAEENINQNNKNAPDQKIKDLQYRLVRLANDDEEKSKKIKSLESEKKDLEMLMIELECQIGGEKMKEIKEIMAQKKDEETRKVDQTNLIQNSKVTTKSGSVHNSKVCIIM